MQSRSFEDIEELNSMTLQVGLVGTDGSVIASDRLTTGFETMTDRNCSMTSKFYQGERFICCWSGDDVARVAASNVSKLKLDDTGVASVQEAIEHAGRNAWEQASGQVDGMNRKVIIATLDGDLWLLEFRNAVPMVNQKRDRVVAGDIRNSAGWFINNYIPVGCAPLQFPVERLIFPAAHAVVVGARENPSGISGLEVLVIRRGSAPVFLDRTQEDALKKRSIRLDAVIRKKLFEPFVLTQHA